jgi:hypothetical protein
MVGQSLGALATEWVVGCEGIEPVLAKKELPWKTRSSV